MKTYFKAGGILKINISTNCQIPEPRPAELIKPF